MALAQPKTPPMDVAAFMAWIHGRPDEERWELVHGAPVAMGAPSYAHALIQGNALAELVVRGRKLQRECQSLLGFGIRCGRDAVRVPDIAVACGGSMRLERFGVHGEVGLDPCMLIEVSSRSTAREDREDKLALYEGLPSVRDYVIIASEEVRVTHYIRLGERLVPADVLISLSQTFRPTCLEGLELSVGALYRGVPGIA